MNPAQKLLIGVFVSFLALHANSAFAQNSASGSDSSLSKTAKNLMPQSSVAPSAALSEANDKQEMAGYGRLPLSFEANEGQTDSRVQFVSHGNGYSLFLTHEEAVLALRKSSTKKPEAAPPQAPTLESQEADEAILRMKLVGGSRASKVMGLEELPGKTNYFIGNDPAKWRTKVANYARVEYEGVYPGVDLLYYGNQRQLEYDFVVAPGADPHAVVLQFDGAKQVSIDRQGDLVLRVQGGEVRLQKPVVYQVSGGMRQSVTGNYVLAGVNKAAFAVGRYDATRPLIVDPTLVYSSYLGGSSFDGASGIAVDSSGAAYVSGSTSSSNFPTTSGAYQTSYSPGVSAAFVAKVNATGTGLVYSTYVGSGAYTGASGIAVDSSGAAYITGRTQYTGFPITTGAFQTVPGATDAQNAFVTKLSADGSSLVYSTYLGGSDADAGEGIVVDSSGFAYVAGWSDSPDFPTTTGAFQTTLGGGSNVFVTKLNAAGSALVYSTYLGGNNGGFTGDYGYGIAIDSSGAAYVTGFASSTNFPTTPGAFQTIYQFALGGGPAGNAFVTKLNAAGSALIYSTYLGGVVFDQGSGIAVDSSGSAYVTGTTNSYNFPTTLGAFQTLLNYPGTGDVLLGGKVENAFVTKLSADGSSLVYSTFLGGGSDGGYSIAVDSSGDAYVVGGTGASDFPTTLGAFQTTLGSTVFGNAFVTELSAGGSALVYSTFLGGSSGVEEPNYATGIALDSAGSFYVTGGTTASNFPTTPGAFQKTLAGTENAFVAKFSKLTAPAITWAAPSPITYGTPLGMAQLDATANVAGTFTYSPPATTVLTAGPQTLTATFTPTDTTDYSTASASVILTVNRATPVITWSTPTPITYGTALSGTQLNATANVPGSFVYLPPVGSVLNPGSQTLSATFTPADTTDYTTATASVSLAVNDTGNLTISNGQTYTFVNGRVSGNITMTGGTLVLNDSVVGGNLQMSGGSLQITNNTTVQGNVQVSGGSTFSIDPSVIGGNLQVQNIPAGAAQNQICGTTVRGNLQFQNNGTAVLIGSPTCPGNAVSGNLQVSNNSASAEVYGNTAAGNIQILGNAASTAIFNNSARGILQCSGNSSALITGGGNTAALKQGQCASF